MNKKSKIITLALTVILLLAFSVSAIAEYGVEENLKLYPNWIGVDAQGDITTMPIFTYSSSGYLYEAVWVEVPIDTDRDGIRDRVSVFIRRPNAPGFKSPSVMEYSPYHEGNLSYNRLSAQIDNENSHVSAMAQTFRYHDIYPITVGINPDTTHLTYNDIKYKGTEAWDPIWNLIVPFTPDSWYTAPVPEPTVPTEYADRGSIPSSGNTIARHQHYFTRGYAMLYGQLLGSKSNTGITNSLHVEEWLSAGAIARWLRGDAQAFTTRNGTVAVKATWSNGNLAMDGTSYPGTTPLVAAMTRVPGIKAIMTEANVTSWYDYYRAGGIVNNPGGYGGEDMNNHASYNFSRFNSDTASGIPPSAGPNFPLTVQQEYVKTQQHIMQMQDRATGDYNAEWDARNLTRGFDKINPDVGILQTSGLMDWNVKPKHAFSMLQAMRDKFKGTHKYVGGLTTHTSQSSRLVIGKDGKERGMSKWYLMFLDHYLLGLDNKVNELMYDVNIPNNITGIMEGYDYDTSVEERGTILPGTTYQKIYLTPATKGKAGSLSYNAPATAVETFADMDIHAQLLSPTPRGTTDLSTSAKTAIPTSTDGNSRVDPTQAAFCEDRFIGINRTTSSLATGMTLLDYIDKPVEGRLMYISEPLTESVVLSGTVSVHLQAAPDRGMGNLSAALIEIGRKARTDSGRTSISAQTTDTTTVFPAFGDVVATIANRYQNPVALSTNLSNYKWVTWGHADVQNPSYDNKVWYNVPEQNYIPNFYFQTTRIAPGKYYNYVIEMDPYNYTFDAGTCLAIMVYGTDPSYSLLLTPECTAVFDVRLGNGSYAKIPLRLAEPKGAITIKAGSDEAMERGKITQIPYKISGNSLGFSSMELELPFDSSIYAPHLPITVTPSGLLSGAKIISSVDGEILKISITSEKGIIGDGTLFTVTYKGNDKASYKFNTPLNINVVSAKFRSFMDKVVDVEVEAISGLMATIPLTSIKIDTPAITSVKRKDTLTFKVALNKGASEDGIVWSVSNPAYAAFFENNRGGNVKVLIADKAGTVVLTAKDSDGTLSHSIILRIT